MFRPVPYVNTVLFLCLALLIEQFNFIKFFVYSLVYYSFFVSFVFIIIFYIFLLLFFIIIFIIVINYGLRFGSLVNIFRKMITSSLDVN